MAMKKINPSKQAEQARAAQVRARRFDEFVMSLPALLPVSWNAEDAFHIFLISLSDAERYATVRQCDVQLFALQRKVRHTGRPRD